MAIGIDASRANHEQKTGVESYAFHVIQELKQILPATVKVVLYTDYPLQGDLAQLPANWSSRVLRWPPKRLWTQCRLSFEMLFRAPDVLFVPAHVPPLIHPRKTVMTVHDIAALRFPQTYSRFERWYSVWSAKKAVETLWRVIVPSEFTKQELLHFFGHERPRALQQADAAAILHRVIYVAEKEKNKTYGHIRVVHLGCSPNVYGGTIAPDRIAAAKEKYGITKPYFLTIGRLEEKKNTWRLVRAFDQLKQTYPDCDMQLVLAGKPGYGYAAVAKHIQTSEYKQDIIKTGWVDEADVPVLLAGASVFVFPSLYEGFGLPVLEAMAAGVPVIASRDTSLAEVAGDAALLVDPFHIHELVKKMHTLTTDAALRQSCIEKGKRQAARFSWKHCAEETARILMET